MLLAAGTVTVAALAWGFGRPAALALVKAGLRREFADVRAISTDQLAAWLGGGAAGQPRPAPVLLDVREPAEFARSHLPGAQGFPPGTPTAELDALARETPVVVYCSVGYRSAVCARRLQTAGFTDVRNLEGSIFQWANEGRPLVDATGGPAARVHPFNARWGRLLRPERRAPLAD